MTITLHHAYDAFSRFVHFAATNTQYEKVAHDSYLTARPDKFKVNYWFDSLRVLIERQEAGKPILPKGYFVDKRNRLVLEVLHHFDIYSPGVKEVVDQITAGTTPDQLHIIAANKELAERALAVLPNVTKLSIFDSNELIAHREFKDYVSVNNPSRKRFLLMAHLEDEHTETMVKKIMANPTWNQHIQLVKTVDGYDKSLHSSAAIAINVQESDAIDTYRAIAAGQPYISFLRPRWEAILEQKQYVPYHGLVKQWNAKKPVTERADDFVAALAPLFEMSDREFGKMTNRLLTTAAFNRSRLAARTQPAELEKSIHSELSRFL